MKFRFVAIFMVFTMLFIVLCGCGKNEAAEETDVSSSSEAVTEDGTEEAVTRDFEKEETTLFEESTEDGEATVENTEKLQQEDELYADEIAIFKGLFDGSTELFSDGTAGVSELINMHGAEKASALTGYAVTDIGGDGIPEFVVGVIDEENKGSQLLAVFTRDEDSSVTVIEGMTKNAYFLLNDNSIFNQGTDGAATSFFAHFTFSENGRELLCKDFWFTAADSSNPYELMFFHNTTGETDVTSSERLDVGEEEFFGKQGNFLSEKKQITLTPFKK